MPRNLTRQRGWAKVTGPGYFRGDAIKASRRGARLVLPRTTVGELRLLAATGRGHGKVRVRVGRRDWHVVDLAGPKASMKQLVVIDRYSGIRDRTDRHRVAECQAGRPRRRRRASQPVPRRQPQHRR